MKESKKASGNYFTGIIGAIIGGAIGAVPWIIAYIYGNMMIALLAILIAGGAYYGQKICKGKITKKVTIIITIISIIIVALVTLLIIPVILIHTEGMNTNLATIQYLYQDEEYESSIIYKFQNEKPYTITKEDGIWVIRGEEIEKLFSMTRFSEDEAVQRFARKLKGMGVEDALERLGAKKGDEVQILDYIFEFKD